MSPKKKEAAATVVQQPVTEQDNITYLPLEKITPNPKNPRKVDMNEAARELVASVKEKGVLQPIIVRPKGTGYEIVAGERRWRAAAAAELATIPAIVRDLTDDEAFDIMTVENLQREDLTEAEEARSFKAYVDAKGPAAIEDLAQRSGISPRYIRRRVRVMELPANILKEWEEGKIAFGVLEQLLRLDPAEVEKFYKKNVRSESDRRVDVVKRAIDNRAIPLGCALFKSKDAGCAACPSNSEVQVSLFGDDFLGEKASCLNTTCFIKHQREYLTKNWPKTSFAEKYGTNGFIFTEEVNWNEYESVSARPHKDCATCPSYVTPLDYHGKPHYNPKVCTNIPCLKKKTRAPRSSSRETGSRNNGHGTLFREAFYAGRIPEVARTQFDPDNEKILRLVLASLIHAHSAAREWFVESSYMPDTPEGDDRRYRYYHVSEIWSVIEHMNERALKEAIRETSLIVTGDGLFGSSTRHAVAQHLGIDLSREWLLHEEYLQKKTIPEILALGSDLGIFADEKAAAYLAESLKRKSINACKKTDLIRLILESGVDLAGRVPKEILTTGKES
jgi:ParB family chromosome partitioning protein